MGIDGLTGTARLTFGVPQLMDGIEVTTMAVALFALGEAFAVAGQRAPEDGMHKVKGRDLDDQETGSGRGSPGCAARSSASPSVPCRRVGRISASFLSYATEQK